MTKLTEEKVRAKMGLLDYQLVPWDIGLLAIGGLLAMYIRYRALCFRWLLLWIGAVVLMDLWIRSDFLPAYRSISSVLSTIIAFVDTGLPIAWAVWRKKREEKKEIDDIHNSFHNNGREEWLNDNRGQQVVGDWLKR